MVIYSLAFALLWHIIGVAKADDGRTKLIKGGCYIADYKIYSNRTSRCLKLCLDTFGMRHGHCFNGNNCYCVKSTVTHEYNRELCKGNNDCYYIYSLGEHLCQNQYTRPCEVICRRWYQTRKFQCDNENRCHCWQFNFQKSVASGKLDGLGQEIRSLRVSNSSCMKQSECKSKCPDKYTFRICLYGECYCLKDLEDYKPYKLCSRWSEKDRGDVIYNIGNQLCTRFHKGPCATICKNALGANGYQCHRVDNNCRCFFNTPVLWPAERSLSFPKLCNLSNITCSHHCQTTFESDYKSNTCVGSSCYCLRKTGFKTPSFDHCKSEKKECVADISLGKFLCGQEDEGGCETMCELEYGTKNHTCKSPDKTCICQVAQIK